MMMEMRIRRYGMDDEQQVIDLWMECNLVVSSNNPKSDIERKMVDSPDLFFLAEADGCVVATCMAGYDGHRGWIYYLAVKPAMQKQGVASRIMAHAERALANRGCPKIDLMVRNSNEGVISFYHRLGYIEDPVVVLSKRLAEDRPNRLRGRTT